MVTGASTADVAVVLVDARKGVIEQTRRHTLIASLLAVPHLVFAVNKMDLVDFDEARFNEIEDELDDLTAALGVKDEVAIPIAALHGDNVVDPPTGCRGGRGRPCSITSRRSSSRATATWPTAASPSSG